MRNVIYAMTASIDGYIADRDGAIDWSAPDDELFRFHTRRVEQTDVQLCGRRLYEAMLYWETVEEGSLTADQLTFAQLWKALPKVVLSKTLENVVGNTKLLRDGVADEISRLKKLPGKDIAIGGAGLARSCMELIDEWHLFVSPVVLGGGTPYFPPLAEKINVELVETRTFPSRIVLLRYRRA